MNSLYEELTNHLSKKPYPFHMPGHKGNPAFLPPIPLAQLDLTELENTDNLHAPIGCIKETERRISQIYGADRSFLLVNGSTAGVTSAICAICGEGDLLAVARNCHRAVYSGMVLSGARPVYFCPGQGEIPKAKAVVVTSPTYEGNVLDIKAIAKEVHSWGGLLIVDEAHGAHFPFHRIFPEGALSQGADVVVHSFHKTLPAFSQSAALHIKGLDTASFQKYLSIIQTSSPSYMIMAATDYMLNKLIDTQSHFEQYVEHLTDFRKAAENFLIPNDDIGKLLLTAPELANAKNLSFEITTDQYVLAMTSVADTKEGFDKLKSALKRLKPSKFKLDTSFPELPEVVLSPREAAAKKTRKARLKDSIGQVSGSLIAPFPPGIPLLAPGERITSNYADCEIDVILL